MNEINSFGVANNPFKLLGDLGITVVQVPTSVSIEGILGDIMFIAETLGVEARGESLVTAVREEIESIAATGKNATEKNMMETKSVYFEISGIPTMVSFGQGAYLNEMIEIAGGRNIFGDQKGWFSPSAEEIINRNPDIIFTLQYGDEDPVSEIKNRKAFENINAIKQDQVFAVDADSASRPSQNILKALREMARIINPSSYEAAR
jgi:iron complex transport system substrate-binding protein